MAVLSDVMNEDENVFHCSRCYKAGSKSNKEMWSRRTREMLHAKHPASVNEHKLRCLECTAQDHSQDTRAMQRLCPGPKEYDTCNGCPKVLVHTEGPGCNVSKAQWKKRYGDRFCLACAPKKRARERCLEYVCERVPQGVAGIPAATPQQPPPAASNTSGSGLSGFEMVPPEDSQ